MPVEELQELGRRLAEHVRFEERELFELIEEALDPGGAGPAGDGDRGGREGGLRGRVSARWRASEWNVAVGHWRSIDRPKANAIDSATSRALGEAFIAFRDDPELRVAIVTGAGERFFSAGWDLKARPRRPGTLRISAPGASPGSPSCSTSTSR